MGAVLEACYSDYDEQGRITKQQEHYLIQPIRLGVKLIQNDPVEALKDQQALMNVFLNLENLGIVI
jgi:hypothetical protein